MIEISIHVPSLLIGCLIGLIVMGAIILTTELFEFDRTGIDIKNELIKLELELTKLKKEKE